MIEVIQYLAQKIIRSDQTSFNFDYKLVVFPPGAQCNEEINENILWKRQKATKNGYPVIRVECPKSDVEEDEANKNETIFIEKREIKSLT